MRTLTSGRLAAAAAPAKARLMTGRDLLLAIAAGLASALVGQLAGRALHAAWPVPASGSLVTALPRAVILLALLVRVNRLGVLTSAGLAEVAAKLALGVPGLMPWSLTVPVVGNLAGDLAWACLGGLGSQRIRLMLTGACLCVARVVGALLFWGVFVQAARRNLGPVHGLIVGANVAAGLIAGWAVSAAGRATRRGENDGRRR